MDLRTNSGYFPIQH